jgi:hypothetical protein
MDFATSDQKMACGEDGDSQDFGEKSGFVPTRHSISAR